MILLFGVFIYFSIFFIMNGSCHISLRNQRISPPLSQIHTHLDVVLLEVGDDLFLVVIEDLVQNGPSLAVLLQQEQAAVPVLRGGGGTAVL